MMNLPVALQLYSVRDVLEKDFEGTIQEVAKMGYQGVELSGFSPELPAAQVRSILDKHGLVAISVHCPFDEMLGNPQQCFENAKTCGCQYIAIPWLDKDVALADENLDATLEKIQTLGKAAKEAGLGLLYHNHDFEFRKIQGEYILDILYRRVPQEYLQTQLDTCWVNVGGEDPAQFLKKYSGRAPLVHLKDFSGKAGKGMYGLIGSDAPAEKTDGDFRFQPIGSGVQNIPAILDAALEAGAAWVIVEQDSSPDMPTMEAAARSRSYLKSLGW